MKHKWIITISAKGISHKCPVCGASFEGFPNKNKCPACTVPLD